MLANKKFFFLLLPKHQDLPISQKLIMISFLIFLHRNITEPLKEESVEDRMLPL
jgi:hypothetical protein